MTASSSHQKTSKQDDATPVEKASVSFPSTSGVKRKQISMVSPTPDCCEHDNTSPTPTPNPKRRFQRRNSKCPTMFYQMLSPGNLMDLQREAVGPPSSPPPGPRIVSPQAPERKVLGSELPKDLLQDGKNYPSTKNLRSAWVKRSRSPRKSSSKHATLTILTEALNLSSAHTRGE